MTPSLIVQFKADWGAFPTVILTTDQTDRILLFNEYLSSSVCKPID